VGRINWGRIYLGGLVADIVVNLFEMLLNTAVLKDDWAEANPGFPFRSRAESVGSDKRAPGATFFAICR
jgi:hypothetical protein